jgi:hypothetical protein
MPGVSPAKAGRPEHPPIAVRSGRERSVLQKEIDSSEHPPRDREQKGPRFIGKVELPARGRPVPGHVDHAILMNERQTQDSLLTVLPRRAERRSSQMATKRENNFG